MPFGDARGDSTDLFYLSVLAGRAQPHRPMAGIEFEDAPVVMSSGMKQSGSLPFGLPVLDVDGTRAQSAIALLREVSRTLS